MVVVAPLADVVQQERQHEQLGAIDLAQDVAEAQSIRHLRRGDALEIANRQQRVLVDRVLVVEVSDHPPRDRLELGEHAPEETAVVHLRETVVESRLRLEQSE